jgi:hypothetical protein
VLLAAHARVTPVHCTLVPCGCAPRRAAPTAAWCRRSMAVALPQRGRACKTRHSAHKGAIRTGRSVAVPAVHCRHPISFAFLALLCLIFCLRPRKSGHKTDDPFAWRLLGVKHQRKQGSTRKRWVARAHFRTLLQPLSVTPLPLVLRLDCAQRPRSRQPERRLDHQRPRGSVDAATKSCRNGRGDNEQSSLAHIPSL